MELPNFICVGAQKSGTTTLHAILRRHPDIYLPASKETKFFCDDSIFSRGSDFYQREFFSKVAGEALIGEVDPDCLYTPNAPRRMRKILGPNLRLVILLRNPADRAYSHYLMSKGRGYETETFAKAIGLECARLHKGEFEREHYSYIDRGRYATQIQRFRDVFPATQMHFLIFETELRSAPEAALAALLEFLGADDMSLDLSVHRNRASTPKIRWVQDLFYQPSAARDFVRWVVGSPKWKTKARIIVEALNRRPLEHAALDPKTRASIMSQHFAGERARVERLTGKDLSCWFD